MVKRILSALILLSLLFSLFSCGSEDFSYGELVITLPGGFSEEESDSYDLVMSDGDVRVSVLRISLYAAASQGIPDNLSPRKFAEYVYSERDGEGGVFDYGDIPYFTEYAETGSQRLYTLYTFYRSKNAYFTVLFTSPRSEESDLRERFFEYADTVMFTD